MRLREAGPDDADAIALLHADSWRRHYRGAYADAFLDGDVVADRRSVWSARLAAPAGSATVLAEDDGHLLGFVHVVFNKDERWGSLVDNLHVTYARQRTGVGTVLIRRAAEAVTEGATGPAMYLWVLEQNRAAQAFYSALGGTPVEKAAVPPPGGVPARLNGSPGCLRFYWRNGVWPDRVR
jgi:GNAT superfamily N-acetyltransferase